MNQIHPPQKKQKILDVFLDIIDIRIPYTDELSSFLSLFTAMQQGCCHHAVLKGIFK